MRDILCPLELCVCMLLLLLLLLQNIGWVVGVVVVVVVHVVVVVGILIIRTKTGPKLGEIPLNEFRAWLVVGSGKMATL